MRFFKYLILFISFFLSSSVFAADVTKYFYEFDVNALFTTPLDACNYGGNKKWSDFGHAVVQTQTNCIGYDKNGGWMGSIGYGSKVVEQPECWYPDYKIVT